MKTTIRVQTGNYAREMAASLGKIQASVIVSPGSDKIFSLLGAKIIEQGVEYQAKALAKLLQERGELDCNIIFYAQDPRNLKDSRDHLVVQFVLDVPFPSSAQIKSEIKV